MKVEFDIYKDGKYCCLTMSYDDGRVFDRRLVNIFDKYGIRGTFHLNSGSLEEKYDPNTRGNVSLEELPTLYKNHEISMHGEYHLHPNSVPLSAVLHDMLTDKQKLEKASGRIMRGMSYPFGAVSPQSLELMRLIGVEYSRAVQSTNGFYAPDDFLMWKPTAHHSADITELGRRLLDDIIYGHKIMYVWGHSFELGDTESEWVKIEKFCEYMGGRDKVWYATNIEIKDYITAQRSLVFSSDMCTAYNPTATDVWIKANGNPVKIPSGQTVSY